jgi:argininosuccinate synthase
MDAFVAGVQSGVTGVVRAKLFKGECTVVGGQSTASTDDERRRRATVG